MSQAVRKLKPKALWNYFADLNAIPRPSKKEARVIRFIQDFGKQLGYETITDKAGNVIIRKPGARGLEDRTPVILQAHLDMVTQKNADTDFDFDTMGIRMYVEDGKVKAQGTTLGADNGIGVAAIMAILADKKSPFPPIEALFTVDEETGMTGAFALKPGLLTGDVLLNLDSEDETEMTIGCAGGVDVTATARYKPAPMPKRTRFVTMRLAVKGLKGGHSGMDIHRGRANANKLMARLLLELGEKVTLRLHSFDGGSLRNAIPREAFAVVSLPGGSETTFLEALRQWTETIQSEYQATDPDLTVTATRRRRAGQAMAPKDQWRWIRALMACPNGIYRLSPTVPDLVQTSNNLARVAIQSGRIKVECLTRSAVDTEKMDCARAVRSAFELAGAAVRFSGAYPGWAPKPDADINALLAKIYKKKYGKRPHITACHAGLECGILKKAYPDVDMISFGPNIGGAHSPDEYVEIESVARFFDLLQETLIQLGRRR